VGSNGIHQRHHGGAVVVVPRHKYDSHGRARRMDKNWAQNVLYLWAYKYEMDASVREVYLDNFDRKESACFGRFLVIQIGQDDCPSLQKCLQMVVQMDIFFAVTCHFIIKYYRVHVAFAWPKAVQMTHVEFYVYSTQGVIWMLSMHSFSSSLQHGECIITLQLNDHGSL